MVEVAPLYDSAPSAILFNSSLPEGSNRQGWVTKKLAPGSNLRRRQHR